MKKVILSAMRPTGPLHIGHLSILKKWLLFQEKYDCYFFIADYHALTTTFDKTEELNINIKNMLIDWLSIGIDPEKSTLFVQSNVKAHSEIFLLLSMITPLSWLERCPSYKMQLDQFKNNQKKDISTYGFLGYPLLQAGDILLYDTNKVPVGKDQLPHIEITREIARRINYLYNKKIFIEPKEELSTVSLIKGIDGRKMSNSYNNQINIMSEKKDIEKKIISMVTDSNRIKKTDCGNPNVCLVFSYHDLFNKKISNKIKEKCSNGLIGCLDCKKILIESLNEILSEYRKKREIILKDELYLKNIIKKGNKKAELIANNTLKKLKTAMHII